MFQSKFRVKNNNNEICEMEYRFVLKERDGEGVEIYISAVSVGTMP